MMFPGSLNSTGVLSPYIKSYYELPKDSTMSTNILPMCQALGMCLMPIGSYFVQRNVNPKLMIILGESVALACFTMAIFMNEFWAFTLFYVLGFGCQNFVYMVPVHHGWLWFPGRPGLVSGIIIGGFGFGSFMTNIVATKVINPKNEELNDDTGYYPQSVNDRFKQMFTALVIMWAGITAFGIASIFQGPVKKKEADAVNRALSNGDTEQVTEADDSAVKSTALE